MRGIWASFIVAASMFAASGCSMGRATWYEAYTADGGNWERLDLNHGRVGSAFSDAGVRRTITDGSAGTDESAMEEDGGSESIPPAPKLN